MTDSQFLHHLDHASKDIDRDIEIRLEYMASDAWQSAPVDTAVLDQLAKDIAVFRYARVPRTCLCGCSFTVRVLCTAYSTLGSYSIDVECARCVPVVFV